LGRALPRQPRKPFDLKSRAGRLWVYLHYLWYDHAYLRIGFQNAHWISEEMLRTNQPWPFQLKWWKQKGIKTVICLRGGLLGSFYALEKDACETLGLNFETFIVTSRDVPPRELVLAARDLFERVEYPALLHCKSGADRAGIMSVFYAHYRLGQPISIARNQLSWRYLHAKAGKTGMLDHVFEMYLQEAEPKGISFTEWVESPAYDQDRIRASFKAQWWGSWLTETLLRRE